jgi:hypothetical protein
MPPGIVRPPGTSGVSIALRRAAWAGGALRYLLTIWRRIRRAFAAGQAQAQFPLPLTRSPRRVTRWKTYVSGTRRMPPDPGVGCMCRSY